MNSYTSLAKIYDYLMQEESEKWNAFILKSLQKYKNLDSGIDFGCGMGKLTKLLSEKGYKMIGIDASIPMLNNAIEECENLQVKPEFLALDILKFKTKEKRDFALCINDVLNYIPQSKFSKFFAVINDSVKVGGIFIFDISSAHKMERILDGQMYGGDYGDFSLIWQNEKVKDKLYMDLTFFLPDGNGKFDKYTEQHTQYLHTETVIDFYLDLYGFQIIKKTAHLGKKLTETADRIVYICRKKKWIRF